jgi:hypothetical protein
LEQQEGLSVSSILFVALFLPDSTSMESIRDRVRSEGPTAWKSLRNWSGEYIRKTTTEWGDQKIVTECRIKAGAEGELLREWTHDGAVKIEATNPRYNFSVSRTKGESEYVLNSGGPNSVEVNPYRIVTMTAYPFFADSCFLGYRLEDILLDDQQFPWKSAATSEDGRIEIRFASHSSERMFSGEGAEFWVVLNPERSWRMESFGMRNFLGKPGRHTDITVQYAESTNTPTRHTVTGTKSKRTTQGGDEFETIEILQRSDGEIDSDLFTLPYYGISESAVLPDSPGLDSRWILLGFGVFMLSAGFWLWRKR